MPRQIKSLVFLAVSFVVLFLAGAFTDFDLNFINWSSTTRLVIACMAILAICCAMAIWLEEDTNHD